MSLNRREFLGRSALTSATLLAATLGTRVGIGFAAGGDLSPEQLEALTDVLTAYGASRDEARARVGKFVGTLDDKPDWYSRAVAQLLDDVDAAVPQPIGFHELPADDQRALLRSWSRQQDPDLKPLDRARFDAGLEDVRMAAVAAAARGTIKRGPDGLWKGSIRKPPADASLAAAYDPQAARLGALTDLVSRVCWAGQDRTGDPVIPSVL